MTELSERLSFTLDNELVDVPEFVQVLPAGEVRPRGKTNFLVDEESRGLLMSAFTGNRTDLVIDYEHQSLSGSEAPAAGWIKDVEDRGADGVWAKVQWTERAKEYLAKREYRYLSPVVLIRKKDGRAVELLGAGLTNLPAIDGMTPVVNTSRPSLREEVNEMEEDYKKLYLNVLGLFDLPDGSGFEEVKAKVDSFATPKGFVAEEEYVALKETLRMRETDMLIKEALSNGRLTPSLTGWAKAYATKDMDGFRDFIGRAMPVVPLGLSDIRHAAPLENVQIQVNRLLGITDESFIRFSDMAEATR